LTCLRGLPILQLCSIPGAFSGDLMPNRRRTLSWTLAALVTLSGCSGSVDEPQPQLVDMPVDAVDVAVVGDGIADAGDLDTAVPPDATDLEDTVDAQVPDAPVEDTLPQDMATDAADGFACQKAEDCKFDWVPPCQKAACQQGKCVIAADLAATTCYDGNPCTQDDKCVDGACKGTLLPCTDSNPCTEDTCEKGTCVHPPRLGPCDDGSACTIDEFCLNGECQTGNYADCADGNPCTQDLCHATQGCLHKPVQGPCSSGDPCVVGATCQEGKCQGGSPLSCDDSNPCTADLCDSNLAACTHAPTAGFCDDGQACTEGDACQNGQCSPGLAKVCNDGNPCTSDSCDPASGECATAPQAGACDDGSACTVDDQCVAGKCAAGKAKVCSDGNPCTDDGCAPATGCTVTNNVSPCADDPKCVLGVCAGGTCKPGVQSGCDDQNPCTVDTCAGKDGCQHVAAVAGVVCAAANKCQKASTCQDKVCVPGSATDCNDNKPCTQDSCKLETGCLWLPASGACDDGDACTTGDACSNGLCAPGKPVVPASDCDDGNSCTTDLCAPMTGCTHGDAVGVCDDGNPCTTNEACDAGLCAGGQGKSCDDNEVCTLDQCDPATGDCKWLPNEGPCTDGNACTLGDKCVLSQCVANFLIPCTDGQDCTTDVCDTKTGNCSSTPKSGSLVPACDGTVIGGRCTRAFYGWATWQQAEQACVTWGGHLARIASDQENTAVRQLGNQGCYNGAALWIGLNDIDKELQFQWTDGGPSSYWSWANGEPNGCDACCGAPEDVVQMMGNGLWNDICMNQGAPCAVCQRAAPALVCDDSNACTAGDMCVMGKCTGTQATCADNNPCTSDSCDKSTGCTYTPVADKSPCGGGKVCASGACVSP
jgi:hypothetical protein